MIIDGKLADHVVRSRRFVVVPVLKPVLKLAKNVEIERN